ncbi:hypothetical protein D3C81_1915240 [compost metagenome]
MQRCIEQGLLEAFDATLEIVNPPGCFGGCVQQQPGFFHIDVDAIALNQCLSQQRLGKALDILQTAQHPVYRVLRGPVVFRQFLQKLVLCIRYFFLPGERVQTRCLQFVDSPWSRFGQPARKSVFDVFEVNTFISQ